MDALRVAAIAVWLSACGSVQQSGNEVAAEPHSLSLASQPADLRQSHPELFVCSGDDECTTAPLLGCHSGLLEAVRHDAVESYLKLSISHRQGGCPLIYVDDWRTAYCNPDRHRCELANLPDAAP